MVSLINASLFTEKKDALNDRILNAGSRLAWMNFPRDARTMIDSANFKAAEHRVFLLCVGPVVLRDLVVPAIYQHFLLLSLSIWLFCDPIFSTQPAWIDYC